MQLLLKLLQVKLYHLKLLKKQGFILQLYTNGKIVEKKHLFFDKKEIVADKWSPQDKFQIVIETFTLTEVEIAEYCRTKGIYLEQIKSWKKHMCASKMVCAKMTYNYASLIYLNFIT